MKKVVAGLVSLLEPGIYDYMDNNGADGTRLRGFLEQDNAAVCNVVGKYFDIVNPGPVASKETADKAIKAFRDADIQVLFVVSLFWSSDKPLLKILRALSDGFVELAGPSMTEQIVALTNQLKGFGA